MINQRCWSQLEKLTWAGFEFTSFGFLTAAPQAELLREMNDRQALYSENDPEPQTGIEPATFWWPLKRSNRWATETQMVS